MKIPFDNIESFFLYSALYYHQLEREGSKTSRFDFVKRLASHSKKLKNNQCPSVAVYCKTIRQYGTKGLWIYDQYCQMLLGIKPHSTCYPLDMSVIVNYVKEQYSEESEQQQFINMRKDLC